MSISIKNIFNLKNYNCNPNEEFFEILFQNENIRIERIISEGHTSPPDFWYDQDEFEWVILLKGKARLKFFDTNEEVTLASGDYLLIEPHCKHRVEWTTPDEETIWLAVFFK